MGFERLGAVWRPRARRRQTDGSLRAVRVTAVVLGGVYLGSLLATALGATGVWALLAGGGQLLFLTGLVLVMLLRARRSRGDRAAWLCFAAALAAYLGGLVLYQLHYRGLPVVSRPNWTDVGYMAFYPLAYAALFLMLRSRVRRLTRSMLLDGVITGLTVAAIAAAVALGQALGMTGGSVAVVVAGVAYPIADLLLLVLVGGALAVIGRGAGGSWWWIAGGLALFAGTDVVYAYQVVHGSYLPGSLDAGWGLAFVCFGVAACLPWRTGGARRPDGAGAVLLPAACALAALGLLLVGYLHDGDPVAGVLAVGAVVAALARTALTLRFVRALADSRRQARTDELTGLPNRRTVYEALDAADARLATGGELAGLVVGLDRVQEIKDPLGHPPRDAGLRPGGAPLAHLP